MIKKNAVVDVMKVLIETLWNVKYYEKVYECGSYNSINRNIVECKDRLKKSVTHGLQ